MGIKGYILKNDLAVIDTNKKFSEITTMKVGGKIRLLIYPKTIESLVEIVNYLNKHHKRYLFIGNGSNIIASDKRYNGIVLSGKVIYQEYEINDEYFEATAFMDLRKLISILMQNRISTLTDLAGIPATLGGAICMNAGANFYAISNDLIEVLYIENGKIIKKKKEDIEFFYRGSEFMNTNRIIISAKFKTIFNAETKVKYNLLIKKRKEKMPIEYPNSGSIFKNPLNSNAYKIIKRLKLDGYRIGDAEFSKKHSNVIINLGKAKAKDIYYLIKLAQKRALIYEDIKLIPEVILLNFKK